MKAGSHELQARLTKLGGNARRANVLEFTRADIDEDEDTA